MDIFVTVLELAGVAPPAGGRPLDGKSLVPILTNPTTAVSGHKEYYYWRGNAVSFVRVVDELRAEQLSSSLAQLLAKRVDFSLYY